MKRSLLALSFIALSVLISVSAMALEYEYTEYVVKDGDTLWSISGTELQGEFQWPLLWKENPDVINPDKLTPGQKIKIPSSMKAQKVIDGKAPEPMPAPVAIVKETPVTKKATPPPPTPAITPVAAGQVINPVHKENIVERGEMLFAGYIAGSMPDIGEIVGSPRKGNYFGHEDFVYLKTSTEAKIGDRFFIIKKQQDVKHPVTKLGMGFVVSVIGVLTVEDISDDGVKARITEAYMDVVIGDRLDTYQEVETPFLTEAPRTPSISGVVVASKYSKVLSGQHDIIHIDKGSKDGLEVGDMLMTVMPGAKSQENGRILIVRMQEATSSAVIVDSRIEVKPGDVVMGIRK